MSILSFVSAWPAGRPAFEARRQPSSPFDLLQAVAFLAAFARSMVQVSVRQLVLQAVEFASISIMVRPSGAGCSYWREFILLASSCSSRARAPCQCTGSSSGMSPLDGGVLADSIFERLHFLAISLRINSASATFMIVFPHMFNDPSAAGAPRRRILQENRPRGFRSRKKCRVGPSA